MLHNVYCPGVLLGGSGGGDDVVAVAGVVVVEELEEGSGEEDGFGHGTLKSGGSCVGC